MNNNAIRNPLQPVWITKLQHNNEKQTRRKMKTTSIRQNNEIMAMRKQSKKVAMQYRGSAN